MSSRMRWGVLALALVAFAASFAVAYSTRVLPARPADPAEQDAVDPIPRIEADARLVLRYVLPDGRRGETRVRNVPFELFGLGPDGVAARRPEWVLRSFDAGQVVVDVPCALQSGSGYVGIYDGEVAIFDGDPQGCAVVRDTTDLNVLDLSDLQRQELEAGIPFSSESELFVLLEGLGSDP